MKRAHTVEMWRGKKEGEWDPEREREKERERERERGKKEREIFKGRNHSSILLATARELSAKPLLPSGF